MNNPFRNIRHAWWFKLTALMLTTAYFILLIFLNNSSYLYASLAVVVVLFVGILTCSSTDSPILLQLRQNQLITPTPNESDEEGEARVWTTDVPPSYSVVMSAEICPPTPPPSYGSAILMIPPPYSEGKETSPRRLHPLSISTQVSVCSNSVPGSPQPREARVTFSTQISVVEPGESRLVLSNNNDSEDVFAETLQLRTKLFLSRQASREDLPEEASSQNNQLPMLVYDEQTNSPQLRTRVFFSRQASREDQPEDLSSSGGQQEHLGPNELQTAGKSPSLKSRVLFLKQASREDPSDDQTNKPNLQRKIKSSSPSLRTRVLLSRQASREDSSVEQSNLANQQRIFVVNEQLNKTASPSLRTRVLLSRQASREERSSEQPNSVNQQRVFVINEHTTKAASPSLKTTRHSSREDLDERLQTSSQQQFLVVNEQSIEGGSPTLTSRVFLSRQPSKEDLSESPPHTEPKIPFLVINDQATTGSPELRTRIFLPEQVTKEDDSASLGSFIIIHDQPGTASTNEGQTTKHSYSRQASREDIAENHLSEIVSEIPVILLNSDIIPNDADEENKER